MYNILLAALAWLALAASSIAQSAMVVRLDTTALNGIGTDEGVPTADGGQAMLVNEQGGVSLWKGDAVGTAQWRFKFPPNHYSSMAVDLAPCENGDLLLAHPTAFNAGWDTLFPAFDIWRIGADGTPQWHKNFVQDTLFGATILSQEITVAENEQGDVFVLYYAEQEWLQYVTITKLSANGDLIWSRLAGDPSLFMAFPCTLSWCEGRVQMAADAEGGCRVMVGTASNDESTLVARVNADGSLAWASSYDYLGVVNAGDVANMVVDAEGNTTFLTMTVSLNGGFHLVRLSPTGELVKVDRYQGFSNCCTSLSIDGSTPLMFLFDGLFAFGQDGEVIYANGSTPLIGDAEHTYSLGSSRVNVTGGRALISGAFVSTPTGTGLPHASPAFSNFAIGNSSNCARVPMTPLVHDVLPNDLFTCSPYESLSTDTADLVISDASLNPEPRPLLGTVDLCAYTPVVEHEAPYPSVGVNRTLLSPGDMLMASAYEPMTVLLRDMKGSFIWQSPRTALRIEVPTNSLSPGLYLIQARAATGRTIGTVKVVVAQ